jgi:hypothetical protein
MGSTTPYGFPYPELTDAPNVPVDVQALAVDVNDEIIRLDAEIAAVEAVAALFATGASVSNAQATLGTTTSTGLTATLTSGTACSVVFTSPPSGKVLIGNNCECLNSGAGFSLCTIQVRTGAVVGSGTLILTAADNEAIINTGTSSNRNGVTRLLEGLTPGAQYNCQQLFRVQSGTGSFLRKQLIVTPQFA